MPFPIAQQLELLLREELGVVEGLRRAHQEAPVGVRAGLRLCLRLHRQGFDHLRRLLETAGAPGEEDDDFEIVEAFDESRSWPLDD